MTAEEVALEEFREAVRGARVARRDVSRGSRIAFGIHASKLEAIRALARIIRAIRAERENRPRIVDVDVLGIAPKEVYPEPVDRHTSSSWQMYRFRFGDLVEIDLGRGRVIRIHGGPRAGAAEEPPR